MDGTVMYVSVAPSEFNRAVEVALARTMQTIVRNNKDSLSKKNWVENLNTHVIGCVGEVAVASALKLVWDGSVGTYKSKSDLGLNLEVRHRTNPDWQLIVRDNDADDMVYILSRGMPPDVIDIAGWIMGKDAKNTEWKKDPGGYGRPAYFVPDNMLQPMELLP